VRVHSFCTFLFFIITANFSFAQQEIQFSDGSLHAIMAMAKDQNKNVFIDTYADWCQPCKRMEKKFKDKEVAHFYNEHFINYRVNMQNPIMADPLRKKYDIVFLPTMMIVDPNGIIKYQVDRELNTIELLDMGQKALSSYYASEATAIRRNSNQLVEASKQPKSDIEKSSNPQSQSKKSESPVAAHYTISPATRRAKILEGYETVEESSEKVLAVLGAGELPPEILLKEAYLRLEFMDGSHKQAAKNYLATQKNWDSETNRKFILDFVNNVNSPEYNFIIAHREKFDHQLGREKVKKTLEILTYRALYNAVPRPSLQETIQLYTNLQVKEPKRKAYNYYISRLIAEDNLNEVMDNCNEYLSLSSKDHEYQYTVARFLTNRVNRTEENLLKASELMESAVRIEPTSLIYLELLAIIYSDQGKTNLAKRTYQKAAQLAKKQGKAYKIYEEKGMALNGL
jgi:thiol-disulfide isomerase/thioredoxin